MSFTMHNGTRLQVLVLVTLLLARCGLDSTSQPPSFGLSPDIIITHVRIRLELKTKVIRRFPKISQLRRRPQYNFAAALVMILLSPGPHPDLPWLGQGTVVAWLLILPATILGLLLGDSLAWRTVQPPAHQSCHHSSLCLMRASNPLFLTQPFNTLWIYLSFALVFSNQVLSFKLSSDFCSHGRQNFGENFS